tara:strand:- start:230 stop:832 length:603 start_codon:yes stop_codon:yes gene_type:complete
VVEVECPYCDENIDLGADASGMYECPYCSEVFEHIGTEISDEDLELIDGIQNGLHHHNRIFSHYKFSRDYRWYHILFQCLLIPLVFGVFMLLETYWNIRKSKSSQVMVMYIAEENCILKYNMEHFKPYIVQKIFVDDEMEIHWKHRPGSDGAVRPDYDYYTIISSSGETIEFTATDSRMCNIKSFADGQNIVMNKTYSMF